MLIAVWNSMRIYWELHGEKSPAHMQEDIFVYHCIAKHHALLQAILPPEPRPNRRLSQAKQSWLSEFFYNLVYGHLAQTYDYWFVYWEKREHKQSIKHLRKDLSSPFPRLSIGKNISSPLLSPDFLWFCCRLRSANPVPSGRGWTVQEAGVDIWWFLSAFLCFFLIFLQCCWLLPGFPSAPAWVTCNHSPS